MNRDMLLQENRVFQGTGGVSSNNNHLGFSPAFCDQATGRVYLSRFASGSPAPLHLLDGLPDEVVLQRDLTGCVTAIKPTVIAGFLRAGCFYTRMQAAQVVMSV